MERIRGDLGGIRVDWGRFRIGMYNGESLEGLKRLGYDRLRRIGKDKDK